MSQELWRGTAAGVSSPAAETAILVTPNIAIGSAQLSVPVRISGSIDVTEGTGGTAYVVRCRQGNGVAGAIVGQALTDSLAAASSEVAGFSFEDSSGYLAQAGGGQYTLTVAETGATVAGTVVAVEMQVEQ